MPELLEIVGQDQAVAQLELGLSGARRPHAYLFVGPAGVGRRTTAMALAKTLLCERPAVVTNKQRLPDLEADLTLKQACGQCADCRMMAALPQSTHPDFHLVYKELAAFHDDSAVRGRVMQELSIEVIRSFLIDPAARRSTRGRGKVFIIREAELMSVPAQNALLKTLEEPPQGVTLILLCEQADQMLPTTRSRCTTVRFGLLPRQFVLDKLIENEVAPPEAQFWAAFTDGSVGRSLRLAKAGLYAVKRDIVDRVAAMNRAGDAELGEDLSKATDKIAEAAIKASRVGETEMARTLAVRQSAGVLMELIAAAFRDAMTLASKAQRPLVNADQQATVTALARKFDLLTLARIIEQLSTLESLLWSNVNPKTIWDNVVITCASAAPLRM
jgi:DNA polymerase III subunit delta'